MNYTAGVIRAGVAAVSGWLVSKGFGDGIDVDSVAGAVGVLVTVGWSMYEKYRSKKGAA